MGNYLAIASVTATLRYLFETQVRPDVQDVKVTTLRPDTAIGNNTDTRINIYLYQVTPNAAYRNMDLPTRRGDSTLIQRPQAALDLHYMISFYGDDNDLTSQRLLGSVVRTLHAYPVLTRQRVRDAISNLQQDTSVNLSYLSDSNLADEVELVKFSPLHLSLEELSKIWSVFYQIPYVLSVAYQGTVVLIDAEDMPQQALPVQSRVFRALPFRQPSIDQIVSKDGDNLPILPTSTIVIKGRNLSGEITRVRIADSELTPIDVSETRMSVNLSDVPNLRAGIQGLQVLQQSALGIPAVPHSVVESDVAAFVVRPTISIANGQDDIVQNVQGSGTTPRSGTITIGITPGFGSTQRAILLLNEVSATSGQPLNHIPLAYSFRAVPRQQTWQAVQLARQPGEPGGSSVEEMAADHIVFAVTGLQPGTYLVRVQVDGAESMLNVDTNPKSPTFNTYSGGPKVTIA